MGRRCTGSAVQRRGVWYARVSLHRDPPRGGRPPRHEDRVVRLDVRAITEAPQPTFQDLEFFFGRIDPGATRS